MGFWTNKGTGKKNVLFQILIFNFLVNRWSQEAVLLRTWSTHEYSKSWEGQSPGTNGSQENCTYKFWKRRFFLAGNQLYDCFTHRGGSCQKPCQKICQKKSIDVFIHKQRHLSIDMKTKIVQHVPRINISIWHKTCDMWHAACDMQHVTCDIITNTHFWAYTWKQKLFSMSQGST